tara:strand:- start:87 stop:263 length:177 start_codon:yes stop_codon:yes gene_type:complete
MEKIRIRSIFERMLFCTIEFKIFLMNFFQTKKLVKRLLFDSKFFIGKGKREMKLKLEF